MVYLVLNGNYCPSPEFGISFSKEQIQFLDNIRMKRLNYIPKVTH